MATLTKTIKLKLYPSNEQKLLLDEMAEQYRLACNYVSKTWFHNITMLLKFAQMCEIFYYDLRKQFNLFSGKKVQNQRNKFAYQRKQLQAKCTKSAKRALKRLSLRENSFMTNVNHNLSRALLHIYGSHTLFVIEDLTGVSFDDKNLSRSKKEKYNLRSWNFYQLEQMLIYKSNEVGSELLKVDAHYTSSRCPKCGTIHKANRHHDKHIYICNNCGYQSNDDRIGAMNIYQLGTDYISGVEKPKFEIQKQKQLY